MSQGDEDACREDEIVLVKAMHSGRELQQQIARLEDAYHREPSSAELESALKLSRCQVTAKLNQGLRAMQTLVHANKKLVFKLAHKFGWERNLPFEDCVMVRISQVLCDSQTTFSSRLLERSCKLALQL